MKTTCISILLGLTVLFFLFCGETARAAPPAPDTDHYRVPVWFSGSRVQGHTRLSLRYLERPIFFHAAEAFREMGAKVFTRHVKSGGEGAWWPSSVGAVVPEAESRNIVREVIDNAHRENMHMIAYYRHMEDNAVAEQHPDWVSRDWKGRVKERKRGKMICLNSPYADFVLTRLLELVEMGADGFYFDEVHMPKGGCWCVYCEKKFKAETGLDLPRRRNPADPVWQRHVAFTNDSVEAVFSQWRDAIHQANPDCVLIVSSHLWPSLVDTHLSAGLFRIADSVKTEFKTPVRNPKGAIFSIAGGAGIDTEAKLALGYTLARDAADHRPAHIWIPRIADEISALYAASGVLTYGCIANFDVPEVTLPNPRFQSVFALGEKVSPFLVDTVPVKWAAIHFPETARNELMANVPAAWQNILYPMHFAFETLWRRGMPVGFVTDSQLRANELAGYKILILPVPAKNLDKNMQAAIADFQTAGGRIIDAPPAFTGPNRQNVKNAQAWIDLALKNEKPSPPPVVVQSGTSAVHSATYRSQTRPSRWVVCLSNRFSWVEPDKERSRSKRIDPTAASVELQPQPFKNIRILIQSSQMPARVIEAISGQQVTAAMKNGQVEIVVPQFDHMAVVVVDF